MFKLLRKFKFVFLIGIGVALGGSATVVVLYNRPGRVLVGRIAELVGMNPRIMDRYAFGYSGDTGYSRQDWKGVKSPTHPEWKVRRGLDVVKITDGFTYPVNMVFVENPGPEPDSPLYYVNELHGAIRYVRRDGKIGTFASGLNNFPPAVQTKSDETGVSGMTRVPGSEDLIVTGSYLDEESGLLRNHILRLVSEPGGRKMKERKVILDLKEFTSPSNQIQQVRFGPDGKLYVSVGDAENYRLSMDQHKFGGKILRLNPDGTACEDNPFYEKANQGSPRDYVFVWGVRNCFDIEFDPRSGRLYATDNGKNVDRFFEAERGVNYGWDGTPDSIFTNALWSWDTAFNPAPVGVTFLRNHTLGPGSSGRCYVATYGFPAGLGKTKGKSIIEFQIDPESGRLARKPQTVLQYIGDLRPTVLGLAEGPDGLYFTDFFGEHDADGAGTIWKLVASDATLDLPDLSELELADLPPVERGKVRFTKTCMTCHRIDGTGGQEGPDLSEVASALKQRLHTTAYEKMVQELLRSKRTFVVEQHPRLKEVLAENGDKRIRTWLRNHLQEPRFDNLNAKMPSFADSYSLPEIADIIEYLMTRK